MIRNGRYALYKGNEYELSEDMDDNNIIITTNDAIIDNTFEDRYETGVYSKIVDLSQLDEVFSVTSYGVIDGEKVLIRKEQDGKLLVGTTDCEIGEKLKLERVDKYGYEGWWPVNSVQVLEDKHVIK